MNINKLYGGAPALASFLAAHGLAEGQKTREKREAQQQNTTDKKATK